MYIYIYIYTQRQDILLYFHYISIFNKFSRSRPIEDS